MNHFLDLASFLIIAFSVIVLVRKYFFKPTKIEKNSCSEGCGGCQTPCELKQLIKAKHQE